MAMAQRQMTETETEVEDTLESGGPLLVKKLEVTLQNQILS